MPKSIVPEEAKSKRVPDKPAAARISYRNLNQPKQSIQQNKAPKQAMTRNKISLRPSLDPSRVRLESRFEKRILLALMYIFCIHSKKSQTVYIDAHPGAIRWPLCGPSMTVGAIWQTITFENWNLASSKRRRWQLRNRITLEKRRLARFNRKNLRDVYLCKMQLRQ